MLLGEPHDDAGKDVLGDGSNVKDGGRGDRTMIHGVSVAVDIDQSGFPVVSDGDLDSSDVTRKCTAGLIAAGATGRGHINGWGRRGCEEIDAEKKHRESQCHTHCGRHDITTSSLASRL
jgi:hypothetical protein